MKQSFTLPIKMVLWLCLGGAVGTLAAAVNIALFLGALPTSKLANPPRIEELIASLMVLIAFAVSLFVSAWRIRQPTSKQRAVAAQWSPGLVLLWGLAFCYGLLVNYPVPPQVHHTGKFLFFSVLALIWSLWFVVGPESLRSALNSRPYIWLKVCVVNMLVFILAGEAIMQLTDPLLARSGLFGDKHTPANLRPYTKVLGSIGVANSQGFRDRERVFERIDFAKRVVALGDSFTWGPGVSYDEAFVTLLERGLNEVAPGAEVINLGVPAWGPHEEFHLLKIYGVRFHPDVVMLNFFIGNDIQNKRGDSFDLPQIKVVAGQSYYVHSNRNFIHDAIGPDRWHLYHNLNYLIQVGSSRLWQASEQREGVKSGDWPPLVSRAKYFKGIHERSDIYLKENTPFFEHHWSRTKALLLTIRDFLQERDIPLLLVMIPEHVQLDTALQSEYFASTGDSPERYDFQKPQRLLRVWCADNKIGVIDLMPAFRVEPNPASLHFQNDFHWTAAGHKLAAEGILPILRERLAAPSRILAGGSG